MRSKLLSITVRNIGCIGPESITVKLDDVLCLVGPNNSGKTTILRAYELAVAPSQFNLANDRCNWAPNDDPSEIVLDVHIPEGMGNVDDKWKIVEGSLRIVRSRWLWPANGDKHTRQTWNPTIEDWSEDGKAGGADNVFTSRLPRPMRIKSLDDAISTEDVLLTLALAPIVKQLKILEADETSQLWQDKMALAKTVNDLTEPHQNDIERISNQVRTGFQGVFPSLNVHLHVEMPTPELKLEALLKSGSGIRIDEAAGQAKVAQQGTGARRALFWSMLQVHNELSRRNELRDSILKQLKATLGKELKSKSPDVEKISLLEQQISSIEAGEPLPEDSNDPALPGYILLIDEPENALHPMAARAAQAHLYMLAQDPEWQVLLTTHSPYFINPLEKHTTIARLQRSPDGKSMSPQIYVADEIKFSEDEEINLKALQLTDIGFAEIFFGSYPVLVEGDTEHAAFIAAVSLPGHALGQQISIIRARGKAILVPLIRMLGHFKTNFGIVHDIDWPLRKDGNKNSMWEINKSIRDEIRTCRDAGVTARHRWSVPDFERFLGGAALGKDKPYRAFERVSKDDALKTLIINLLQSLLDGADHDPVTHDPAGDFLHQLEAELTTWAAANGESTNPRLVNAALT